MTTDQRVPIITTKSMAASVWPNHKSASGALLSRLLSTGSRRQRCPPNSLPPAGEMAAAPATKFLRDKLLPKAKREHRKMQPPEENVSFGSNSLRLTETL